MKKITLGNSQYEVEREYKSAFDKDLLQALYTEYFEEFDYILGDFSYDKLRLKGFFAETNEKCKEINSIREMENYVKNYCAYECRYFLLKKVK